jgi:hypothetical protein
MRIHFLRLESPVNASPKNRRLIMTYGDYGEKKTYPHEVADSRKITRQEVGTVAEVDTSHDHRQGCSLVPSHLEDQRLPSSRDNVKQGKHHSVDNCYDRDAGHLKIFLARVLCTQPGASIVK